MLATKSSPKSSSVAGMGSARPLAAKGFQMNTPEQETHLDSFLAAAHRRRGRSGGGNPKVIQPKGEKAEGKERRR